MKLSDPDRALLRCIQTNANLSLADVASAVGMATSTVWRKMQDFEAAGLIKGRVALIDPAQVDAKLCVFASVRLADHSEEGVAAFTRMMGLHPEIMEAHAISGSADYMVKIRCRDVEAYEAFMTHNLLRNPHVAAVTSSFSLKELKYTTALPL